MGRSDYSTDGASLSQADSKTYMTEQSEEFPRYSTDKGNGGIGIVSGSGGGGGLSSGGGTSSLNNKLSTNKKGGVGGGGVSISGLNRRLRTEYIDVDPNDDSISASLVRGIVGLVGSCFSPRQILVALRLLKAITVAFIALDGAANLVYISCVEFVSDDNPNPYFGQRRDTVLRLYGFAFGILALLIELDKFVMKNFKVLKGFLARFGLLFFVSTVTYTHPSEENHWNYSGGVGVPTSAVIFQMVTAMVL